MKTLSYGDKYKLSPVGPPFTVSWERMRYVSSLGVSTCYIESLNPSILHSGGRARAPIIRTDENWQLVYQDYRLKAGGKSVNVSINLDEWSGWVNMNRVSSYCLSIRIR